MRGVPPALDWMLVKSISEEICAKQRLNWIWPFRILSVVRQLTNWPTTPFGPSKTRLPPVSPSEGRRVEIRGHLEEGCPACRKQVEIAHRCLSLRKHKVT